MEKLLKGRRGPKKGGNSLGKWAAVSVGIFPAGVWQM